MGVGWTELSQVNPRLVYAPGSGYGLSGPDRDNLAMDLTIQAVSGLISTTGFAMLLDKIRAAAAARLDREPAQIEITDGYAGAQQGRSVALAELAEDGVKADASFANRDRHTYAYGTAAARVTVDPGTGR